MIHFKKEGEFFQLGLNLHRAPSGFVAIWVWFDFAKTETFCARLRFRMNVRPIILWSVDRVNIIEGYLHRHDLELVHKEVLEDLMAEEDTLKRLSDNCALIKPI